MLKTKNKNLNDENWEKLFDNFPILKGVENHGYFDITSTQINTVREARLMTKFDHENTLPEIFRTNKLAILPTARGKYRISTFDLYQDFPRASWDITAKAKSFIIPEHLHSLTHDMLSSETVVLNAAYSSLVLQDFLEEDNLLPTSSGRMGTGSLQFQVKTRAGAIHPLKVEKAQMEIDGCYEGLNSIALIEAKNKFAQDFLIRQLYYPYKYWVNKVEKNVRPIFQVFSNDTLYFFEYEFKDPNIYNSIILRRQAQYRLEDRPIDINELYETLTYITPQNELAASFPQADRFERIINMFEEIVDNNGKSKNELTDYFGFDARQTQYYFAALKYLGLASRKQDKNGVYYYPTRLGKSIRTLPFADRQIAYAKTILSHKIFHRALEIYFEKGLVIDLNQARNLMYEFKVQGAKAETTLNRRAQTIISWIKWIIQLTNDK